MVDLYENIVLLCEDKNISVGKMCNDLGLSRGMMTDLKMGRKKALSLDTLSKISAYFDVPLDFLALNPPFNLWDEINKNRRKFVLQTGLDESKLKIIWNITPDHSDEISLHDFVSFVSTSIKYFYISKDGDFVITLKDGYEKASTNLADAQDGDIKRIERARKNMPQQKKDQMMRVLQASFEEYFSDNFKDDDKDE